MIESNSKANDANADHSPDQSPDIARLRFRHQKVNLFHEGKANRTDSSSQIYPWRNQHISFSVRAIFYQILEVKISHPRQLHGTAKHKWHSFYSLVWSILFMRYESICQVTNRSSLVRRAMTWLGSEFHFFLLFFYTRFMVENELLQSEQRLYSRCSTQSNDRTIPLSYCPCRTSDFDRSLISLGVPLDLRFTVLGAVVDLRLNLDSSPYASGISLSKSVSLQFMALFLIDRRTSFANIETVTSTRRSTCHSPPASRGKRILSM